MNLKFFYLALLLFVFACEKDSNIEQPIINSHCIPQENGPIIPKYKGPGFGFEIVHLDSFNYTVPYSNPNNKNEFVYFVYDYKLNNSGIYIYNILTKQKSLVLETDLRAKKRYPQSDIRWSRKGWLIFADFDNNIYKIKPNGDSLTQLTYSRSNFVPEWNLEGTKFCIEHISKSNKYYTLICDENGNNLDSLQFNGRDLFGNQPHWQHEKYILGTNYQKITIYDCYAKKVNEINTGDLEIGFPMWINNDEFIYNSTNGIYTYNIINNQIKQLRKTVNSNIYFNTNLLDNNQIICERNKTVLLDSLREILGVKRSICIINPCDTIVTDFDLR
ncbi:MAG: hypothetical protein K9G64_07295 [Bacteroidia bacterium]|jgi:hypothetical protein|nr:hypothetical protein [Bacteroidia bacterium]